MGECTSLWWVAGRCGGSTVTVFGRLLGVSTTSEFWGFVKVSNTSPWMSTGVNWDLFYLQLCWSHSLLDLCVFVLQKTNIMMISLERGKGCNNS